ncbi:MAG TPA: hypothetical protein VHD36_04825 [Pirellulales bacterium]|nr:hypothetical protein [Pirellulales bacterium]
MFRLHQITRRGFCRACFVLGCLAPLVAFVAWGTYRHSPLHGRHEESSLRTLLGLRVAVAGVAHPRPGLTRYRDVALFDPETGKAVARSEQVEYRTSALDDSAKIALAGVTIERGGLAHCHALLQRLLRRDRDKDLNLTVTADEITIVGPVDTEELASFSGLLRASKGECEARFVLEPSGEKISPADGEAEKSADRILVRFARSRESGAPKEEWELHTGRHSVPCDWFQAVAGEVPGLVKSRLQGSIWVKDVAAGQVALRGRITGVELAPLVTPYFGHLIEGTIDVDFAQPAHFSNGRIVEMRATVTGGPGRVGRALLAATSAALGCPTKFDRRLVDGVFAYEALAFEFLLDPRGQIAILGRLADRPKQLISDSEGRGLLFQPNAQPQPVVNLVQVIEGAAGPTVPATPQAAAILGRLPLMGSATATTARPMREEPSPASSRLR